VTAEQLAAKLAEIREKHRAHLAHARQVDESLERVLLAIRDMIPGWGITITLAPSDSSGTQSVSLGSDPGAKVRVAGYTFAQRAEGQNRKLVAEFADEFTKMPAEPLVAAAEQAADVQTLAASVVEPVAASSPPMPVSLCGGSGYLDDNAGGNCSRCPGCHGCKPCSGCSQCDFGKLTKIAAALEEYTTGHAR